jgi:4-hydroxy-tetrahydrodipicolinate synthase
MISREEVRHALTGPIMSLNTPFFANGEIDYQSIRQIIDFTIDAGSKTIILTSGDSLYTLLTDTEVAELTKVVVAQTAGRAMVVAADRIWWTGKDVEFAKYAREVGADMLMVLPPDWASSCTEDTLVAHYAAVAEHMPVMVVTNFLGQRPLAPSLEVLRRLRDEVDGIYAVKDDICGEFGRRLGLLVHDRWAVFASGTKREVLNNVPYGCDGYMSCFILFKPEVAHAFWDAVQANNLPQIRKIIADYDIPMWDELFASFPGSFDAVIHGILELNGLAQRWRRKPYYSLNDREMAELADLLEGKGWL